MYTYIYHTYKLQTKAGNIVIRVGGVALFLQHCCLTRGPWPSAFGIFAQNFV